MDYLPDRRTTIQKLSYCTFLHVYFVHCEIFDVNYLNRSGIRVIIFPEQKTFWSKSIKEGYHRKANWCGQVYNWK